MMPVWVRVCRGSWLALTVLVSAVGVGGEFTHYVVPLKTTTWVPSQIVSQVCPLHRRPTLMT
ncbi:hypothetical protein A5724_01430 [Mycobacterium sp. ACS1612]|nr:hypothetical protein A5724_01430 [Mycobacterium sp. ACS1612]